MEINLPNISPEVQQARKRFGIVGNSPMLIAAVTRAVQVAPIDLSVLITGESGTGKEFFPKIIHAYSPRKHARYIAVNCGALPEGTIDSELFGHEKGAFTGAVSTRKGYFEEADGGTIFLDEVAELPLTTQARLLRVLETGEFIKVGSSTVQKTNVRIVAATNVNILEAVAQGRFREDLYYRLSTVQITIPALRDRGNDILLLARKFASDFSERYMMPQISIGESARSLMLHYRWPGNVRQLKNVVEQLSIFHAGDEITNSDLASYLPSTGAFYAPSVPKGNERHSYENEREMLLGMIMSLQHEINRLREEMHASESQPTQIDNVDFEETSKALVHYKPAEVIVVPETATEPAAPATMTLEQTERETIRRALEANGGRRKATAQELNISERTLYRKIKEYGLE